METTNPASICPSQTSLNHPSKIHQNTNEDSKNFFKKVFETYNYDLYGKLFKLESEPFQNYLKYNDLKKGEKRIVEYFIEESGVKNNIILPIEREGEYTIGNNKPFFTPLPSDTKKNVRRNLKTISLEHESRLIDLAFSIINHGIKEPKHEIKLYSVDYNALHSAVNNVSSKIYSAEEIVTSIALMGHLERAGYLKIGKKVWGTIFRHADYKEIIEVLKDFDIITKTANAVAGWYPNQYSFNIVPTKETYLISEGKSLNRIKNSKITFSKNSPEKQLEMAENEGFTGLVEDLKIRKEGYKYIDNGLDKSKLKKEYKWMQYENMLTSFSIHFQQQIKIAQETGIYKSFWHAINEPRINAFFEDLKKMGINV